MLITTVTNPLSKVRFAPNSGSGGGITLVTPASGSSNQGRINQLASQFTAGDAIGLVQSWAQLAIDETVQATNVSVGTAATVAVQSVGVGLSAATTFVESLGEGFSAGAAAFKAISVGAGTAIGGGIGTLLGGPPGGAVGGFVGGKAFGVLADTTVSGINNSFVVLGQTDSAFIAIDPSLQVHLLTPDTNTGTLQDVPVNQ